MALKRRASFQHRIDPDLNRAMREVRRVVNLQQTSIAEGRVTVLGVGAGAPSGVGAGVLKAYSGAAIDIYVYKPSDPSNPDTLIGSTTTDVTGHWELDLASYCWTNSIMNAFQITYKRDGVVIGHKCTPEAFWENANDPVDGYLPIMVNGRELHT